MKTYDARYAASDDVLLRESNVLTDFTFPWSDADPPRTAFRAVWDEDRFRFRFDVVDHDIVLADGETPMEKVVGSDRVEIFFSTGRGLSPYYGLEMDPRGEILAYEARYHRQFNWDWECDGLVVESERGESGYAVWGQIPLLTFQRLNCLHPSDAGWYLIAGLYRAQFSRSPQDGSTIEDWMSWVTPDVATPDFHVPSSFGIIRLRTVGQ